MTDYEWTEYPCEGLDNQGLAKRVQRMADALDAGLGVEIKPRDGLWEKTWSVGCAASRFWDIRIGRPIKTTVVYWRKGGGNSLHDADMCRLTTNRRHIKVWQRDYGGEIVECDLVPREQDDD